MVLGIDSDGKDWILELPLGSIVDETFSHVRIKAEFSLSNEPHPDCLFGSTMELPDVHYLEASRHLVYGSTIGTSPNGTSGR